MCDFCGVRVFARSATQVTNRLRSNTAAARTFAMAKPAKRRPCAVLGCGIAEWDTDPTRHRLPQDDAQRTAWLERIGFPERSKRLSDATVLVCGRHFAAEDYYHDPRLLLEFGGGKTPRLKPNALPTLFLPRKLKALPKPAAAVGASIDKAQNSQPVVRCGYGSSHAVSTVVGTQTEMAAGDIRILHSMGTQTLNNQRTISVQASRPSQKNIATQVRFTACMLMSRGPQAVGSSKVTLASEHADGPTSPVMPQFL